MALITFRETKFKNAILLIDLQNTEEKERCLMTTEKRYVLYELVSLLSYRYMH